MWSLRLVNIYCVSICIVSLWEVKKICQFFSLFLSIGGNYLGEVSINGFHVLRTEELVFYALSFLSCNCLKECELLCCCYFSRSLFLSQTYLIEKRGSLVSGMKSILCFPAWCRTVSLSIGRRVSRLPLADCLSCSATNVFPVFRIWGQQLRVGGGQTGAH